MLINYGNGSSCNKWMWKIPNMDDKNYITTAIGMCSVITLLGMKILLILTWSMEFREFVPFSIFIIQNKTFSVQPIPMMDYHWYLLLLLLMLMMWAENQETSSNHNHLFMWSLRDRAWFRFNIFRLSRVRAIPGCCAKEFNINTNWKGKRAIECIDKHQYLFYRIFIFQLWIYLQFIYISLQIHKTLCEWWNFIEPLKPIIIWMPI